MGDIAAGASGTTVLGSDQHLSRSIQRVHAVLRNASELEPRRVVGGRPTNGMTADACYTPNGTAVAQLPGGFSPRGDVANPYWTSPPQAMIDARESFPTFDAFPGVLGLPAAQAFGSPYVASALLNYRHRQFAVTPGMQFQGGGKYGVPIAEAGIDPASGCGKPLVGDRYNATTCPGVLDIPDPFTGAYDGIGAFTQPNELIRTCRYPTT